MSQADPADLPAPAPTGLAPALAGAEADSDLALLRAYTAQGSQAAFAALVARRVDLVYSVALRLVRSPQLAEEVAQSVFVDLARSAGRLRPGTHLAAWLHTTSRRAAIDVVRRESRRQAHEARAAAQLQEDSMKPPPPSAAAEWSALAPLLDEAVESLGAPDRSAILLRFFENKNFREIGAHLGVSDDTAQKRVSRALEQLRRHFLRRGVAVSAAGLASQLSAHVLHVAPAGLGAAISSAAALSGAAASGTGALAAAGTLAMTTTQKILVATAVAAAIAGGVYQLATIRRQHTQLGQLQSLSATWQREIQRLDRERTATAASRAAAPAPASAPQLAAPSDDPALDARLRTLVENVRQLKQRLDASPADRIPELRYLDERDWFGVAQRFPGLGAGADPRAAFAALRNAAKGNFLRHLDPALKDYLANSGGQLPAQTAQLAPFFDPPLDDPAILQRYEMLASGPASALLDSAYRLRERAGLALNPRLDNLVGITGHGVSSMLANMAATEPPATPESLALQAAAERAQRAYQQANPGRTLTYEDLDQVIPYFDNVEDGTKFVAQIRAKAAQIMPPTLNRAFNDARRAYDIAHHGAEPTEPMELATYFQKPEDGARYLDFISRHPVSR